MPSRTLTPEVVHETQLAPATWGQARQLVAAVRNGGRAWLELGGVLESLRSEFFSKGGRPTDWEKSNRKNNSPHGAASSADESGWQAKVREELGISDDTARRWMLDGQRYRQICLIDSGAAEVEGKPVNDDVREAARAALAEIEADPSVRPARQWAGIWSGQKGKHRAAVDHARNIARGMTALQTSLPHWSHLEPEERAALEKGWELIRPLLPTTFKK